jgi:hypothetical protein
MNHLSLLVAISALLGCNGDVGIETRDDDDPSTPGGPRPPGAPGDPSCERIEVGAHPGEIPRIMIVLDKSRSMQTGNIWRPAVDAVEDLTERLNGAAEFGLTLFPNYTGSGLGVDPVLACTQGEVFVDLGPDHAGPIGDVLGDTRPDGNTPTRATLEEVRRATFDPDRERPVVLLVTDGAPNCPSAAPATCTCTSGQDPCSPEHCLDHQAVDAVSALAADGVSTYVIGFNTSDWTNILNEMAAAGATGHDTYFPVEDGPALEAALAEITGTLLSCSYELEEAPYDIQYVRVVVDGAEVEHESRNSERGWRIEGDTTIELVGEACDALRDTSRGHTVEIAVECDPVFLI